MSQIASNWGRYAAFLMLCAAGTLPARAQAPQSSGRLMRVADIIQMTSFGSQPNGGALVDIDVPSPDGRLHAVVVRRGDTEQNVNVFSILVFHTSALFSSPTPDTLLTFASSSNRPAISHLTWLADNHTLAFLGEQAAAFPQVYTIDLKTRQITQRTHHTTVISSYAIAPSGDPIVYAAEPALDSSDYAARRQRGFAVGATQFVGDVFMGAWSEAASSRTQPQVFVLHAAARDPSQVSLPGPQYKSCDTHSLSVAPNGRVALLQCTRQRAPVSWLAYTNVLITRFSTIDSPFPEFALLDLQGGQVQSLLAAPVLGATFRWAPTGASVVFANAFLPLDDADAAERRARAVKPGIAEVDLRTHRVSPIAQWDSLDVVAWDSTTNTVDLVPGTFGLGSLDGRRVRFRKTTRGWIEVRGGQPASSPVLVVQQELNRAPRLVAFDPGTRRRAVALDPNPQLVTLRLGRVEVMRWRTKSGQEHEGGLYLPPDFAPGRRYPLVIQTHGFDSTTFRPDGTYPTANAAQPMAARGILVLQLGLGVTASVRDFDTSREAQTAMEEFEGAIDHLDGLGLIDRSRVGLIGFSRTVYHVLYTLTHSRYPIAAAAVSDGVDFSYFQYLLFRNVNAELGREFESVNDGPPLGRALDRWRGRAPGFNLDRVVTPLRLEAIGREAVLEMWEPYAGLLLQHKPVELFVLPNGAHILVKPWERRASSEGNLDWFRFWLKGEEDPDPAKREQYARWRVLRKLQEQQQTAGDTAATRHGSE